jgi:flagellar basal body-associated protein FliL
MSIKNLVTLVNVILLAAEATGMYAISIAPNKSLFVIIMMTITFIGTASEQAYLLWSWRKHEKEKAKEEKIKEEILEEYF